MNNEDLNIDYSFLHDFDGIKIQESIEKQNYFDVAGYPHYENVISNILAFYFDSQEEHNMKDLWIKSLFMCYKEKKKEEEEEEEEEEGEDIDDIDNYDLNSEVEIREHSAKNKKIDLLLALNNAIIVIENKIYAGDEENPYNEYHAEAERIAEKYNIPKKNIYEILLSTTKRNDKIDGNIGYRFYNITYEELFYMVKENIGDYLLDANEKWLTFQNEFMKNVENLYKERPMEIDKELQYNFNNNEDGIKNLIDLMYSDIENKKSFILGVVKNIKNRCPDLDIDTWGLKIKSLNDYFSIYINIKNNNNETIAIEPYILRNKPTKMYLEIWNRNNKNDYNWVKEKETLSSAFSIEEKKDGRWGNVLLLKEYNFSNEEDLKEIERLDEILIEIVNVLKKLYN